MVVLSWVVMGIGMGSSWEWLGWHSPKTKAGLAGKWDRSMQGVPPYGRQEP